MLVEKREDTLSDRYMKSSLRLECGLTSVNNYRVVRRASSRIVGGQQAIPHSHPWQVLLHALGKFCGGQLRALNRSEQHSSPPPHASSICSQQELDSYSCTLC